LGQPPPVIGTSRHWEWPNDKVLLLSRSSDTDSRAWVGQFAATEANRLDALNMANSRAARSAVFYKRTRLAAAL